MKKVSIHFNNFTKYSYLLKLLVIRDIKKKYKESFLGLLWSLLSPLMHMIVLTIVFSNLFERNITNFPLYLIAGRLIFEFFSNATTRAMTSIISSATLIKKVYIPKYILTLAGVTSNFIIFCISLIDLLLVMVITGSQFSWNLLFAPIYLILLYFFVLGISYIVATLNTIFRDIQHLYGVVVMILMYISAIFYPVNILPASLQPIFTFNPVYQFIKGFRMCVYYTEPLYFNNLLYCTLIAVVSLSIGLFVFWKNQDKLIFYV